MYDDFLNQPSNQLLRRAYGERIAPLTIVVGSGVSKSSGLPDWKALREKVQLQIDNLYTAKTSSDVRFSDPRFKRASTTEDYWAFFQLAKDLLGSATYNGIIRDALDTRNYSLPQAYDHLLNLSPKGVITLNLDPFTGQAFAQRQSHSATIPIYGIEIARKWQLISDEKPYLVYMHGHISDPSTWILTQQELENLTKTAGHSLFLSSVYMNNTVIFAGLSADDIAISAPLLRLKEAGFMPPRLFWVTTRTDSASDQWAKDNDVQKITYRASNDSEHENFLSVWTSDLISFDSFDVQRLPPQITAVRTFGTNEGASISPKDIAQYECEDVRKILSDILVRDLEGLTGDDLYDRFEQFCKKYRYPIQTKSFYKDESPPDNMFFGYEIKFPELGSGNFGEVFQAVAEDGRVVCVKIMHSNIVGNREMLGGFRRGVRSMQILTKYGVDGIVPIVEAFEMPPTIIMNIVSGNSLQELFGLLHIFNWSNKVKLVVDIGNIVDSCHKLPEMVLHRDIKPSNIMLEGLDYAEGSYEKLYVLDFDMSWHKNSSEKDIIFESRDDFGYLAPEQTDPAGAISTRSTKVDGYGLAMTAFALFGGQHPMAGWSMSVDWESRVNSAVRTSGSSLWKCLELRVARAIIDASRVDQEKRLDFNILLLRAAFPTGGDMYGMTLPIKVGSKYMVE